MSDIQQMTIAMQWLADRISMAGHECNNGKKLCFLFGLP
jgi:hypothetical protein